MTRSDAGPWLTRDATETDGCFHVYPLFGPPHYESRSCWCHPEIERETPLSYAVVYHNVAQ